jgi:hypothetical protein
MMKKNKKIEQLKLFYVIAFVLGAIIIAPTHIFSPPSFMYARFPTYLKTMGPFLGISWPTSFELYHNVLYVLGIIISLNAIGILIYPKFKIITKISSLISIFLFSLIVLFFFVKFINVNAITAIVFGTYSSTWLILSSLTFKASAE